MLPLPLVELAPELSGACGLCVRTPGDGPPLAGTTVSVEAGRAALAGLQLGGLNPPTHAIGSATEWIDTLVDPVASERLEISGDEHLVRALIAGLHEKFFGGPLPSPEDMLDR